MSFEQFKNKIISDSLNSEQLFQKFFVDAETFYFAQINNTEDLEYKIKKDISNVLNIHLNDIYIVGSGKTGFSMKPKEYGRPFDGKYQKTNMIRDKSDLDIAIVSPQLFDIIQETIYDWTDGFKNTWDNNVYYDSGTQKFGVELKYKFLEYLGKGWYRPDLAPQSFSIETNNGILNQVLTNWRSHLNRKVSYGLYKSWHFFKKYQLENIEKIMQVVNSGELI